MGFFYARLAREIMEAVLLALIALVVLQGTVRNFKVEGSSMSPTMEGGQYLVVDKCRISNWTSSGCPG